MSPAPGDFIAIAMREENKLEQYIQQHRPEFDQVEPTPGERMWAAIHDESSRPSTSPWAITLGRNWRWSMAAGLVLLLGVSLWWQNDQPNTTPVYELATYFPELAAQEKDYQRLINQRESELQVDQLDKSMYRDIFQELQQLEDVHQEYLADVPAYQQEELLVSTLLKYYEHKLRILERLSHEIQKQNIHEDKEPPLYQ